LTGLTGLRRRRREQADAVMLYLYFPHLSIKVLGCNLVVLCSLGRSDLPEQFRNQLSVESSIHNQQANYGVRVEFPIISEISPLSTSSWSAGSDGVNNGKGSKYLTQPSLPWLWLSLGERLSIATFIPLPTSHFPLPSHPFPPIILMVENRRYVPDLI